MTVLLIGAELIYPIKLIKWPLGVSAELSTMPSIIADQIS